MYNIFLNLLKLILLLGCLFIGIMEFKRGIPEKSKMKSINGRVVSKIITHYYSGIYTKKRHDIFLVGLENKKEQIAINYPSESAAKNDTAFFKIDSGKVYQFYLDPSYPTVNYQNNGLNIIEFEGKEIYRKNNSQDFYGGILFIILSLFLTYWVFKYGKSKNQNE